MFYVYSRLNYSLHIEFSDGKENKILIRSRSKSKWAIKKVMELAKKFISFNAFNENGIKLAKQKDKLARQKK